MPDDDQVPARSPRGWSRSSALFIACLALATALVWPSRLGGSSTFIIVKGSSMEPTYHSGDLLYARSASTYRVGDVAVYRVPKRGTGAGEMIVHRIRARTADGRYVMQGDNRKYDDGALPSSADLVARPVLDLGPLPATMLLLLPWLMMLLCAAVAVWLLWPAPSAMAPTADRRVASPRVRRRRVPSGSPVMACPGRTSVIGARNVGALVAVVLALSGLVVLRQVDAGHGPGGLGSRGGVAPVGEITFATGIDFSVRP